MKSRSSIVDRPGPRKARACRMNAWCSGSARGARPGFDRGRASRDQPMSPSLSELLKLPAGERADLAMALWESLSETEREGEIELTPDEAAELDRRWMEHVRRPESSIPWDEVRRKLLDRE